MSLSEAAITRTEVRDTLGRPLTDLRVSIIDNCNLRCTYCMPQEKFGVGYRFMPEAELLTFGEIARLARLFALLGVRAVRITGGEPLLRKRLPDLIASLARLDGIEDLALTTNGLLLRQHAQALRDAGLDRITVSLDALDDETFGRMNGRGVKVAHVLQGVDAAKRAGFQSIKINVVVQKGVNDAGVLDLAAYFRGSGCIVRFIEYMDVGTRNHWELDEVVASKTLMQRIHAKFPLRPLEKRRREEVATRYAYEDGAGEIGFISSVTNTFCRGCSRARISAGGRLYTCLFATGGTDLRGAMRAGASDVQLLESLRSIWQCRTDRYSELRASMSDSERNQHKVEMYEIGG